MHYQAVLREAPLPGDDDSNNPAISGAWSGMSISGEVTAPVVYAHAGNPEDYDLLRKNGISVKGKIVLVRYSNPYSYRGFKALTAQREGAAAMLVYSDPQEDGYKKGKVDPDGPWGPEYHIQRGAITYDFMVPGDPTTPGWASVPGAKRIPIEEAISAPKIMAMPLSWHDAKPLLENMDGPVAPDSWQGALGFPYHLGGEKEKVHLKIEMANGLQPYYVVEARIRGSELPDEWVVLGNHRDAWVFGGVDPQQRHRQHDGTHARPGRTKEARHAPTPHAGHLQLGRRRNRPHRLDRMGRTIRRRTPRQSRRLHQRRRSHVRPELPRTSRRLARPHAGRDQPHATRSVGKSLYEAWKATASKKKKKAHQSSQMNASGVTDGQLADTRIGSGSDHTVFLNFVGMPVIGLQFDGDYGVYHSAYDDFYWMNHFGDPGYKYHTLMSQLWGVTALRLANADLLPFDFASYAGNVRQFVNELIKMPTK